MADGESEMKRKIPLSIDLVSPSHQKNLKRDNFILSDSDPWSRRIRRPESNGVQLEISGNLACPWTTRQFSRRTRHRESRMGVIHKVAIEPMGVHIVDGSA